MGERDRLDGEKKALENQLTDQTKRNDALSSDVGKINANMDVMKTALKAKEDLAAKLQTQADDADKSKNEAVGKQNQAEEELARVQVQLTEANEAIAKLQAEKKTLTEENEKKANALAVARSKGFNVESILAMETVNARVQSVDPQMNFVILSVGEKDKVARGYTFDIHRGNQYIGRVRVDNVGADWASATIEFTAPGRSIQVQDSASTRL
jgi:chromosome segregation ATPase